MTLLKPTLILNRLVVWARGHAAYDQEFHTGVNIIRGANGSGKSTILDFIFYALGGDFTKWKREAAQCEHVFVEVNISGSVATLRRPIVEAPRQPMAVFWGPYEQAKASAVEGWQIYPFQRGVRSEGAVQKESFSQILFRALEFPEVRADGESNITMHQALRLIYLDQVSRLDSLLRDEQFDSALTRATVGDLLLGTYDAYLYSEQLGLIERERELAAIKTQHESMLEIFGQAEQEINIDDLNRQMAELEEQRRRVDLALLTRETIPEADLENPRVGEIQGKLLDAKRTLLELETEEQGLQFEIADSRAFLSSLESRASALQDSVTTRTLMGSLPLLRCPQCLTPIREPVDQGMCPLCKERVEPAAEDINISRMRQELSQQIRESTFLLEKKEKRLEQIARQKPQVAESVNRMASEYRRLTLTVRTRRDEALDELLIKKGALDSKIEALHQHAKTLSILNSLKERRLTLESDVSRLRISIVERQKKQQAREIEARAEIDARACELLHSDLPRQEAFQSALHVAFDFRSNTFSVDGENQFSASSMVYLKNSIHFAIFVSSTVLPFFRYPRLFLCDNIEDKGMESARSQNFQKLIVKSSEDIEVEHQIIFATSMIDPILNNSPLCVGPEYTPTNKSLKI